jgi:hypothetical protein
MTTVRVFKVENRLTKLVGEPGGRTLIDALKAAEQRIEAARERSLESLGPKIDRLYALAKSGQGGSAADAATIYALANEIFALAGLFGQSMLAEAALSLCDLIAGGEDDAPLSWPAVDVHIDALRLLRAADGDPALAGVIDELRKVSARRRIAPN